MPFFVILPFRDHIPCSTCGSFVKELCSATMGASPEIVVDGSLDATFACVIPLRLLLPFYNPPQVYTSSPGIHNYRDSQEFLSRNRRESLQKKRHVD